MIDEQRQRKIALEPRPWMLARSLQPRIQTCDVLVGLMLGCRQPDVVSLLCPPPHHRGVLRTPSKHTSPLLRLMNLRSWSPPRIKLMPMYQAKFSLQSPSSTSSCRNVHEGDTASHLAPHPATLSLIQTLSLSVSLAEGRLCSPSDGCPHFIPAGASQCV